MQAERSQHKQVRVKVNARVDEGIAPLVLALSEFPEVVTYESCQGGRDLAWAQFVCGDWAETVRFTEVVLIPIIEGQDKLGIWTSVTVYGRDSVRMNLYVLPENIGALAGLLSSSCRGRSLES